MARLRIALTGKSGAGKSEVASRLACNFGFSIIKTGAICRSVSIILFGNDDKSSTQRLDDALTSIDPSIFLKASMRTADLTQDVVIDLLRFRSDLSFARSLVFCILRVTSPSDLRNTRLVARGQAFDPETDALHRSETELDFIRVDFEIDNNGSLHDLDAALAEIVAKLR